MNDFFQHSYFSHPHFKPQSIIWEGDDLVDYTQGGQRFLADGTFVQRTRYFSYHFTGSVGSPSNEYSVIYANADTKGLVLKNGDQLRQINRDYYQAGVYDYPVSVCRLPSGREALIHCPEEYCRIVLEDVESGEAIGGTGRKEKSEDFFHSKFTISPDSRFLVSSGWVWHPWSSLYVYDLVAAEGNSAILDERGLIAPVDEEIGAVCFVSNNRILMDCVDEDEKTKYSIRGWEIGETSCYLTFEIDQPAGLMMPVGEHFVVSFYEHPKLYDLRSGNLVYEWREIDSGNWASCFISKEVSNCVTIDQENCRFAVTDGDGVHVFKIDPNKL